MTFSRRYLAGLAAQWLAEDVGGGDLTTEALVHPRRRGKAEILAREELVVCGLWIAREVFRALDPDIRFHRRFADGRGIAAGDVLAVVSGRVRPILTAERTALNVLQRLSGIATLTRRYVERVAGTGAVICATRKTTPGLRALEKYAVVCGGGSPHRAGLFDAALIKDNHVRAAGSVAEAVKRARRLMREGVPVQVEVENFEELEQALQLGAGMILLDNMTPAMVRKAVRLCTKRAVLEASGGITLKNVRQFAETGVDRISVGALTHSARAADISLDLAMKP